MKNYQDSYNTSTIPVTFNSFLFESGNDYSKTFNNNLAKFDKHLPYCRDLLMAGGLYLAQINEYLKFYPKKSMYFMFF